ncbi:hypothetical protein DFQ29_006418 [Apophysomyces sp. BC1021]|nr:hypothetical protein DFQ29_006418 [Apophysomyces sp. BC1021]
MLVLIPAESDTHSGIFISSIKNIDCSVSVVPDFGIHFNQILVNLGSYVGTAR